MNNRIVRTPKRELIQGGHNLPAARVRKGDPMKPSAKDPSKMIVGNDRDTFRFDWNTDHPHIDPVRAQDILDALYPDLSVLSPVVFLRDAPGTVYQSCNEEYKRSDNNNPVLVRRCDGDKQYLHRVQDGSLSSVPIPCLGEAAGGPGCQCKPVGRLFFALPEWSAAYGLYAEFLFITHGTVDIESVGATVDHVYERIGGLRRYVFTLYRTPVTMNLKNGKTVTKSMVKLDLAPAAAQAFAAGLMDGINADLAAVPALPDSGATTPRLPAGQAPANAFPPQIEVAAAMAVKSDSEGVPVYWFKGKDGLYWADSPDVFAEVIKDDFTAFKPGEWTVIQGYQHFLATVDGDEVIAIEGVPNTE